MVVAESVTVVEPVTVSEPVTIVEPATVAEPVTVVEPVTVLDALQHNFASCSIILEHFRAVLNETKILGQFIIN